MKKLLICILLFFGLKSNAQTTIYVDSAATGMNNGTSWANAYNELSDALHYAWQTPLVDSVLVAKGTYEPRHRAYNMQPNRTGIEATNGDTVFHIRTGLNVKCGFPNGGGVANSILYKTILLSKFYTNVYMDSSSYWATTNDTTSLSDCELKATYTTNGFGVDVNGYSAALGPNYIDMFYCFFFRGTNKIENINNSNFSSYQANVFINNCDFIDTSGYWALILRPILINNSSWNISNCLFEGYKSDNGSAIVINTDSNYSNLIDNCMFKNDTACVDGGAIFKRGSGTLSISNTMFENCRTSYCSNASFRYGGAIKIIDSGYFYFRNNIFINCNTSREGGALSINGGNIYFYNNVFEKCSSDVGALDISGGVDTFKGYNNIFYANGYGISQIGAKNSWFINNTIYGNYNSPISPGTIGLTFVDFQAYNPIYNEIRNNLFYNNFDSYLWGPPSSILYFDLAYVDSPTITNISNNYFTKDSTAIPFDMYGSLQYTNGSLNNINSPNSFFGPFPNFVDTSNLKGPDGIWMTADDGLRLDTNSLALNAGLNSAVPASVTSDIKGDNRIYGMAVDLGAYENQTVFFLIPQITPGPAASSMNQQFLSPLCSNVMNTTLGLVNPPSTATIWGVINPGNINVAYNAVDSTMSFTTPAIGSYTLSLYYANASDTSKLDTSISIVAPVVATVSISNISPLTICHGDTIGFSANVVGGTANTYQWRVNGVNAGTNSSTFTLLNGSNGDSVDCIITFTSPCIPGTSTTTSSALIAIVNPLPNISITPSPSAAICMGDNLSLTASGANSYSWSGGISNGMNFSPSATTIYTVTATDNNSCSNTSAQQVVVNALPTISVTSNPSDTICIGDSLSLTASGANSYSWSGGISNGLNFSPSTTGIYTVTATDINSCSNTSTQQVVVNALPSISITSSPSDTICAGDSLSITASGASNYSWSGGISNGINFSPSTTGMYTVTATDINSCSNTSTQQVVVNALPSISITSSPSDTICMGDSLSLTASGANSYSWSGGISNGINFSPSATTIYTVTATDNNSCSNTSTQQVVLNPLPTVQANASDTTICASDSLTLFGSGANMYSWTNGVLDNIAFAPAVSQSYLVTGTDNNNCSNIDSIFIQVDSNQNPSVSLVSTPNPAPILQSILFTANVPASITNYQIDWYINGSINTTMVSPNNTFTYTANGLGDSVWCVLHAVGCYAPDSAISNILGFVAPDGVLDYTINGIRVYPNPVSTELYISSDQESIDQILLLDMVGNIVSRKDVKRIKEVKFDIVDIANGQYHLLIQTSKGRTVKKIQIFR